MKIDGLFFRPRLSPDCAALSKVLFLVRTSNMLISFIFFLFPAISPYFAKDFRQFLSPFCKLKFGSSKSPPLISFLRFYISNLHHTLAMPIHA